jgi:molecular chaperone GrpE
METFKPSNSGEEPEVEILSSKPDRYDDAGNAADIAEEEIPPASTPAEVVELKKQIDELKEKILWAAADFDNYKKRALKEQEDHLKFSQAGLLKEVLVVADNLERALAALPTDDTDKGLLSLKQGVELTLRQFQSILTKNGVAKIVAVGKKFDPRSHEVMFQEETTAFPDDTVMEELQSGYLLHERVLRPTLVKVAKNHSKPAGA